MRAKLVSFLSLLRSPGFWVTTVACGCFLWAYGSTLAALAERWANSPQYTHGFLVPLFALVVLWFRREHLKLELLAVSGWGIPLLLAGGGLRLAGAYFYYPALDSLSLLPSLAGLCVLLGGWWALRWAWPAIAFLVFMLPLPFIVEGAMAQPLQRLATVASTYVVQTLGLPAVAEGNIVTVNDYRIGVVEACNGLGMLVVFFALSTALAFVLAKRPLWERVLIAASAVPVALVANVARITTTAVLGALINRDFAQVVFHDWGGWLMMPLALFLLWLELRLVDWLLFIPARRSVEPLSPVDLVLRPAAGAPRTRARRKGRPQRPANAPAKPRR
jgi:exosortase